MNEEIHKGNTIYTTLDSVDLVISPAFLDNLDNHYISDEFEFWLNPTLLVSYQYSFFFFFFFMCVCVCVCVCLCRGSGRGKV